MNCQKCRNILQNTDNFCPMCGTPVSIQNQTPTNELPNNNEINSKKKKPIKKLIIIIAIILFVIYIGYRIIFIYTNKEIFIEREGIFEEVDRMVNSYKNYKTFNITHQNLNENEEYFQYENLKMRNDFEEPDIEELKEKHNFHSYENIYKNKVLDGHIYMNISKRATSLSGIESYDKKCKTEPPKDKYAKSECEFASYLAKKIKQKKITNDFSLALFAMNELEKKYTMFSSPKRLKHYYDLIEMYSVATNRHALITGDINGYISYWHGDQSVDINLYKDNDNFYVINLIPTEKKSAEQLDRYLQDLLSTVVID